MFSNDQLQTVSSSPSIIQTSFSTSLHQLHTILQSLFIISKCIINSLYQATPKCLTKTPPHPLPVQLQTVSPSYYPKQSQKAFHYPKLSHQLPSSSQTVSSSTFIIPHCLIKYLHKLQSVSPSPFIIPKCLSKSFINYKLSHQVPSQTVLPSLFIIPNCLTKYFHHTILSPKFFIYFLFILYLFTLYSKLSHHALHR